jgi:hypothetical protein
MCEDEVRVACRPSDTHRATVVHSGEFVAAFMSLHVSLVHSAKWTKQRLVLLFDFLSLLALIETLCLNMFDFWRKEGK